MDQFERDLEGHIRSLMQPCSPTPLSLIFPLIFSVTSPGSQHLGGPGWRKCAAMMQPYVTAMQMTAKNGVRMQQPLQT